MTKNKMAAPVFQHRSGRKARESITITRAPIVHKIRVLVHTFVVGLGAAGFGLFIGAGLPQLLGIVGFRPCPLVLGVLMTVVGCWEEIREDYKEKGVYSDVQNHSVRRKLF